MAEHACPNCGKPSIAKSLISKKTGKPFIIQECSGTCKNDKGYKFSFFPPKEPDFNAMSVQEGVTQPRVDSLTLGQISKRLDELFNKMQEINTNVLQLAMKIKD